MMYLVSVAVRPLKSDKLKHFVVRVEANTYDQAVWRFDCAFYALNRPSVWHYKLVRVREEKR